MDSNGQLQLFHTERVTRKKEITSNVANDTNPFITDESYIYWQRGYRIICVFKAGVILNVHNTRTWMNYYVYSTSNQAVGLLGSADGDSSNDLTSRQGVVISSSSNSSSIYTHGQTCELQINDDRVNF